MGERKGKKSGGFFSFTSKAFKSANAADGSILEREKWNLGGEKPATGRELLITGVDGDLAFREMSSNGQARCLVFGEKPAHGRAGALAYREMLANGREIHTNGLVGNLAYSNVFELSRPPLLGSLATARSRIMREKHGSGRPARSLSWNAPLRSSGVPAG